MIRRAALAVIAAATIGVLIAGRPDPPEPTPPRERTLVLPGVDHTHSDAATADIRGASAVARAYIAAFHAGGPRWRERIDALSTPTLAARNTGVPRRIVRPRTLTALSAVDAGQSVVVFRAGFADSHPAEIVVVRWVDGWRVASVVPLPEGR